MACTNVWQYPVCLAGLISEHYIPPYLNLITTYVFMKNRSKKLDKRISPQKYLAKKRRPGYYPSTTSPLPKQKHHLCSHKKMGQKNQQNNWSSKKLGQKKKAGLISEQYTHQHTHTLPYLTYLDLITTHLFIIVAIITIFFFIFITVINETIFYSIMNNNFKNFCTQIIQTVVDES